MGDAEIYQQLAGVQEKLILVQTSLAAAILDMRTATARDIQGIHEKLDRLNGLEVRIDRLENWRGSVEEQAEREERDRELCRERVERLEEVRRNVAAEERVAAKWKRSAIGVGTAGGAIAVWEGWPKIGGVWRAFLKWLVGPGGPST